MQLASFSFLLYFLPLMLVVYFALFFSRPAQKVWLVAASLAFCLLLDPWYLLAVLAVAAVDYFLVLALTAVKKKPKNHEKGLRILLFTAYGMNLGPLLGYRYLQPYLSADEGGRLPQQLIFLLSTGMLALRGISYLTDLTREEREERPRLLDTILYFTFFPTFLAGPLIHFQDLSEQLKQRRQSADGITEGFCRLVVGLAKLVLLAGPIWAVAEFVFSQSNISGIYTTVPISLVILGVFSCALGIYYYLSGFSDLGIGLGWILGLHFYENFRYPLLAASVEEFWQRCFITTAGWFNEYIYQPLEKKRRNNDWMVVHTLLMCVLAGLWLGPGLPNLFFAIWTFAFILVERIIELDPGNTKSPLRHFFVLLYIVVAVIALKTDSFYQFTLYISNLLGMRSNGFQSELALLLLKENWIPLAAGLLGCFPVAPLLQRLAGKQKSLAGKVISLCYPLIMAAIVALIWIFLSAASYNPYLMIQEYLWS